MGCCPCRRCGRGVGADGVSLAEALSIGRPAAQRSKLGAAALSAPLAADQTAAVEQLRRQRQTGPAIARALGMARSTVGLVLRRLGLNRLALLEPRPPVIRYERERPGELIHIDIKTLGKIDGIGHRITGQHALHHRARGIGYEHLHVAIDDASRLAYVELLPSLGREGATGFLNRALAWYARLGAKVERVMTDNGSAYPPSCSPVRCSRPRPATSAPGLTRRAPTARPSASSRHRSENGPTPDHTPHQQSDPKRSANGPTPTTSQDHTPESAASALSKD